MNTTEQRLEFAMQALKAIAAIKDVPGACNDEHLLVLAVVVARTTIEKIAVKTTDFCPAGREKDSAAYNARYEPRE